MSFHDIKLPDYIETYLSAAPNFAVSIAKTTSGREIRRLDITQVKQCYAVNNCLLSLDQFEAFMAFYLARAGCYHSFRLNDSADNKARDQKVASFDEKGNFQLTKTYNDTIKPYTRVITKPVKNTVKLSVNQTSVSDFFIDYNTGKITLFSPINDILIANFDFDVHVRFSNEKFKYDYLPNGSVRITDLIMEELI